MDIIKQSNSNSISTSVCAATIGAFDGVHRGHQFLIDSVKAVSKREHCSSAVVTFATPPQQVINPTFRPQLISTFEEKMELLAATGIDKCIVLDFTKQLAGYSAQEFMKEVLQKQFGVAHLVIGYDHRFGHNRSEGFADYVRYGKEMGMTVESVSAFQWRNRIISSSVVRQLLTDGNIETANDALGYPYYIEGVVSEGHQIGRTIGFPTANIKLDNVDKIIPKVGVYAVKVDIAGSTYNGMLNIGNRPTVDNGNDISIEVNIFDFDKDIYCSAIKVSFIQYIRPEQKFNNIEALENQLYADKVAIEAILDK
jgi:riboflavin kinase/FMN adenylyltransferase